LFKGGQFLSQAKLLEPGRNQFLDQPAEQGFIDGEQQRPCCALVAGEVVGEGPKNRAAMWQVAEVFLKAANPATVLP